MSRTFDTRTPRTDRSRSQMRLTVLPILALLIAAVATPALAQTAYTRVSNGNWSNAGGWSPVGVPGSADSAHLSGRTVTLDMDVILDALIMTASSQLEGSGDLIVTGSLDWQGGRMAGAGTTVVQVGASLVISGTATKGVQSGRLLRNETDASWIGNGQFSNGGGAVFENAGSLEISAGIAAGTALFFGDSFNNTGSLTIDSPSIVAFSSGFNNQGTVEVVAGTLALRGFNATGGTDTGSYEIANGATLVLSGGNRTMTASASISGAGTVAIPGGTTSLAGAYNVHTTQFPNVSGNGIFNLNADASTASLAMGSGTLGGSGTLTVTEAFTWEGGTMRGTGTTVVAPGVAVAIDTGTVSLSDSRTLRLQGSTSWTGSTGIQNGSSDVTLVNTGVFTSSGSGTRTFFAGTFENEGTLVHDGGIAQFTSGFNNTGVVQVDSGTLRLQGFNATGGTDTGSYLIGVDGTLEFAGGNRTLTQTVLVAGDGVVSHSGGALTHRATVAPGTSPGLLSWVGTFAPYSPQAQARLDIEIAGPAPGTGHDQLAVTGNAVLAGGLDVAFIDGFVPEPTDEFVLVTSSGCISGAFGQTNLPDGYTLVYLDQQVRMVPGEDDGIFASGFETSCP